MHRKGLPSERLPSLRVFSCALLLSTVSWGGNLSADDWGWKEGRRNITQIASGQLEKARQALAARLEKQPGHGEALFASAISRALEGSMTESMGFVRLALDAGLPLERLYAGPRGMTMPIVESPEFAKLLEDRKLSPPALIHGPMLGALTDSSARFWARTRLEADLVVEVTPAEKPSSIVIASPVIRTSARRDYTAVARIEGLRPDTAYLYRLQVDDVAVTGWIPLRTFPARDRAARFDVAFGGGAAYTPAYERVFTTIAGQSPRAFLQLGDNVYIDQPKLRQVQRYCYYRRQSSQPYRALARSTPVFAIWDDHDFGDDDCWGGPEIDEPQWKRPVWEVFRENWNNPGYAGGEARPGVWFDTQIGDVHFVFLDCRYYRTSPRIPEERRSMLGPVQKRWLLETLVSSRAVFKVVVTSVPFSPGVKPGSRDPWDGYSKEREEIFEFIADEKIEGVVLISADRHRSDLWKIERPDAYDLYEFQSSRLTNIHKHPVMKKSIWGFNEDRSFGMLRFDTTLGDPQVKYEVVTVGGETVRTFTLRRSALGF